jgi:DNA-binding response OmpR family regulator
MWLSLIYVVVVGQTPNAIDYIRRNSLKILVIEDNQGVAEVISLAFELHWPNAQVVIAETGEIGLWMLESENPQLVILDIGLPGIDGFDVLKATRSVSNVPVIMLTARGEEAYITRALDLGADDYLTKPFSHLVLLARAQAVLRRSLMGAETSFAPAG